MAIVRKDKMLASYNGNLETVKIFGNDGKDKTSTTNGVFVVVEGLLAGEREIKKARLGATSDHAKDLLLVHNPEVMYDQRLNKLDDYITPTDKVARAYRLYDGDVITLTQDLFAEAVAVGDKLIIKSAGKLGKDATNLPNAKIVFEVIEDSGYELHKTMKSWAVQIVRQK
ncbi:hypothetical protein [Thermoactinomyces sp. DSM 45892]|uniref:hypothetical protein n=1 Tax=Thermoactinomyces sp. DSM 45892 TaxID=1882753 RepID=UPI0008958F83|nr:hypothetical protein [Thermoactinomyces sp. DSM 45892]SDX95366.1 hypothetical protein SAMN05444416_10192 [Thermoactinomyces sp. DSM 45892]